MMRVRTNELRVASLFMPEARERLRLPLYLCRVPAGFPSPADDYVERQIDLNEWLVGNKLATYAARELLERVYKPGFVYNKAGVFLTDIVADAERKQSMLVRIDGERRARLMEAVDGINRRHGRHTVRPLAMGYARAWEMRRRYLSGRYTTRLDEVLRVKAC